MPSTDITKCANGENCLRKDTCWRHLCPSEMWQAYSDFFPGDGEICFHYMEYKPAKKEENDNKSNS